MAVQRLSSLQPVGSSIQAPLRLKLRLHGCLQKDMLEDHKRTGAYYQAVMQNRRQFEGRVVLDVGTGSGILAVFAAKAGARKVYAVEATNMAKFAKQLVASNNVSLLEQLGHQRLHMHVGTHHVLWHSVLVLRTGASEPITASRESCSPSVCLNAWHAALCSPTAASR